MMTRFSLRLLAVCGALSMLVACGGGGGGGGGTTEVVPTEKPATPVLSLGFGIKQQQFSWLAATGASYYRLLENPDGVSGYTQVGGNISTTSANLDISVHRHDWPNALRIFIGRGNCGACHVGPTFSNGEFHDTGLPFFVAGGVDPGRHAGIRKLQANPLNLLGRYNDDRSGASAVKTRQVAEEHRNFGEFKVPSLRNVARAAPYMDNGSLATLADVVRHYSEVSPDRLHSDGEALVKPLRLSAAESADLVAFLESLSERASALPPRRPDGPCR